MKRNLRSCVSAASLAFLAFLIGCVNIPSTRGLSPGVDDIAIDHINVLLPRPSSKTRVSFTLEAFNGCFNWNSVNPEVASVEPLFHSDQECQVGSGGSHGSGTLVKNTAFGGNGAADQLDPFLAGKMALRCSRKAIVTAVSSLPGRSSTWIVAEESITGRKIRCEVYVDEIKHIQVDTTTREMYRDDVEVLDVRAWDSKGNVFSSLEGLRFQWSIFPDNPTSASSVLQFVPFKDSNLNISQTILNMEAKGQESSQVLVQGVETGRAKVAARLIELGHPDVDQDMVLISVLEPLQLHPLRPVHVTPGTAVQYVLQSYKRDAVTDIKMPNDLYKWTVDNSTVASITKTGLVTTKAVGRSVVHVEYENLAENYAQGDLYVVIPAYISLKIVPAGKEGERAGAASTSAHLVSGKLYLLEIEVYDSDSHRLYKTDNCVFEMKLSDEFFETVEKEKNEGSRTVNTLKTGITPVTASLTAIRNVATGQRTAITPPITVKQEVIITTPIVVSPKPSVALPFIEGHRLQHTFQLHAAGGGGEYNWYTSNSTIASVSARGVVTSQGVGEATLMVLDRKNPSNSDSLRAIVSTPTRIEILRNVFEIEVGSTVVVPIDVFDDGDRRFDNCTVLPLIWKFSPEGIFQLEADGEKRILEKGSSGSTHQAVKALHEGHTEVTVRYEPDSLPSSSLSTSRVHLFAFEPLRQTSPTREALVTVGASAMFIFSGGPKPWHLEPSAFFWHVKSSNEAALKIERLSTGVRGNQYSFRITCLQIGDYTLTATVGNRVTSTNPHPATRSIETSLHCHEPAHILLYPYSDCAEESIERSTCSVRDDVALVFPSVSSMLQSSPPLLLPTKYQIRNDRKMALNVTVLDSRGHRFLNFSSLSIEWQTSNEDVGWFPSRDRKQWSTSGEFHMRTLLVSDEESMVSVSVRAKMYKEDILKRLHLHAPSLSRQLAMEITFLLMANVAIEPSTLALFNHPDNRAQLHTKGGSGFFHFNLNSTKSVGITHQDQHGRDEVEVFPIASQGPVLLTATDRCLSSSDPASSVVYVSGASEIVLKGKDHVLLGREIMIEVLVLDRRGVPFPPSQYNFINLTVHVDNDFVTVERVESSPKMYRIEGQVLGTSRITFSSPQRAGGSVSSVPQAVHVLQSFSMRPKHLILLPTASCMLHWTGGPPVDGSLQFSSSAVRGSPISVDNDGHVVALSEGEAIVRGVVSVYDSSLKEDVAFSEDTSIVTVKRLEGIKIVAAATRVLVGHTLSLHVAGTHGETPISFASGDVRFRWTIQNQGIVSLHPVYEAANITLSDESGFSVRAMGKRVGATRVQVSVTAAPADFGMDGMSAVFQFHTVDQLRILSPADVRMSPGAYHQIETNRDSRDLKYELLRGVQTGDCAGGDDASVIDLHQNGRIFAKAKSGQAFVLVSDPATSETQVVKVTINPVHSLQLIPKGASTSSSLQFPLPLGSSMVVVIVLSDASGIPFHCTTERKYDITSTQETVSFRYSSVNSTVTVSASQPGHTVMRVKSLEGDAQLEDFLMIRVGNALFPSFPVIHLGGQVKFRTQSDEFQEMEGGVRTVWSTENPHIAVIDPVTGVASAVGVGSTNIYHRGDVYTYTTLKVVSAARIDVDTQQHGYLALKSWRTADSNGQEENTSPILFPAFIYAEDDELLSSARPYDANTRDEMKEDEPTDGRQVLDTHEDTLMIHHNLQVRCSIEQRTWATAVALEQQHEDGVAHACAVSMANMQDVYQKLDEAPSSLTLVAVVLASSGERLVTWRASFPLIIGFYHEGVDKVHLSQSASTYLFEVVHGDSIPTCSSADSSRLSCRAVSTTTHRSGAGSTFFELSVSSLRVSFDDMVVELYEENADQLERLYISYTVERPSMHIVPREGAMAGQVDAASSVVYIQQPASLSEMFSGAVVWVIIGLLFIILVVALLALSTMWNNAGSHVVTTPESDRYRSPSSASTASSTTPSSSGSTTAPLSSASPPTSGGSYGYRPARSDRYSSPWDETTPIGPRTTAVGLGRSDGRPPSGGKLYPPISTPLGVPDTATRFALSSAPGISTTPGKRRDYSIY